MRPLPRLAAAALLAALFVSAPAASADWGDWGSLVDEAKEQLGKTKEALGDAADSLDMEGKIKDLKKAWDSLEVNERLRYAFGDGIDAKSGLTGRFFDLKRPLRKVKGATGQQPKPAQPGDMPKIIREFIDKGWDTAVLAGYYSPEVKLLAPYFYLPRCKAEYAPLAFQCDTAKNAKNVKPSCWVVLYQGVVKAPKTGKFRFVGMCDDTIIVRFNHKQVLESGWFIPTKGDSPMGTSAAYQSEITTRSESPAALYNYEETPHWNKHLGGLASGTVFQVKKGATYPIEILLSEIPGSEFGFVLLVEEIKDNQPKSGKFQPWESPKLHLFRTNGTLPDKERIQDALGDYMVGGQPECPPFEKKSLIWKIDSDATEKSGFWDRLLGELPDKDSETAMGIKEED